MEEGNMEGKILASINYRIFELLPFNRDVKKVKALMESMKKHGWINAYPMNVVQNGNGKLKIKDGHHRFEVATTLGIPVKYVVCNDTATIYELDKATNKWSVADHMESYCRAGNIEYVKMKEYCRRTGIAPMYAISMLSGETAGSYNQSDLFKTGAFVCKNTMNADIVADIVLHCKKKGIDWAHNSRMVIALSKIAWVDGFSPLKLKQKITTFPFLIEKKPHVEGYLEMLENVYNYKSQDKVPLKFLATSVAKDRQDLSLLKAKKNYACL